MLGQISRCHLPPGEKLHIEFAVVPRLDREAALYQEIFQARGCEQLFMIIVQGTPLIIWTFELEPEIVIDLAVKIHHPAGFECRNNLHAIEGISDSMKDSDYHVCLDCSLIFARRRQSLESVAEFYQWFALLERRGYAVYPPPTTYIQAKAGTARIHMKYLADYGVLSPGMTVAHLRCDVGSLLAQITGEACPCCR